MPQLAGSPCGVCGRPVGGRTDGAFCPACGRPVHVACANETPGADRHTCPRCGSSLARRADPVGDRRTRERADGIRSFAWKKIVGGGVISAAGLVFTVVSFAMLGGGGVYFFGGLMSFGLLILVSGRRDLAALEARQNPESR